MARKINLEDLDKLEGEDAHRMLKGEVALDDEEGGGPSQRDRLIWGGIAACVLLTLIILWRSCSGPNFDVATPRISVATVDLQGPEVLVVPASLEGPYRVADVTGPRQVQLEPINGGNAEQAILVGLVDGDYTTAQQFNFMNAEARREYEQRMQQLMQFKRDALRQATEGREYYVLRMSAPGVQPAQVYLLEPHKAASAGRQPEGLAEILNVQLVRDGKANIHLDERHPMRERMEEAQQAAIADARRSPGNGSIWNRFDLRVP